MRRYEYKVVKVKASTWSMHGTRAQEAMLEVLNHEGRSGWHLVVTHSPGMISWNDVLLEREVDR